MVEYLGRFCVTVTLTVHFRHLGLGDGNSSIHLSFSYSPNLGQLAHLRDLLQRLLAQTSWPGYCPAYLPTYLYLALAGLGVLIQLGKLLEPLQLSLLELTP